ncbi:MAG: mitochondrial fusion and transport protein ugo1 [Chrysothrix sp. TS-e1954]|nr:MAG: mitochondrial fusion and transport protein ugo1 [Chrysothrix sp. TS-e1954]
MDQSSSYAPLRPSSEGPNPLRPYYRPPSIGIPPSNEPTSTTSANGHNASSNSTFGSSARDMLSDINYNDLLGDSGATGSISIKGMLDQLAWRYSSVLMAQPFEVAKTVLQVRMAPTLREMRRAESKQSVSRKRQARSLRTDEDERYRVDPQASASPSDDEEPSNSSEEDDDAPSYFTSTSPSQPSHYNSHPSKRRHRHHQKTHSTTKRSSSISSDPDTQPWRLSLSKPDSLLEVLSQLWSLEGTWGVWKGANITFIYGLLLKTVETWTRSMLSAVLNLPDAGLIPGASTTVGGLDIIDSPSPLLSLSVAVAAAGVASLVLAPLDIARTRLLITPTTQLPRTMLSTLRLLPSYLCPPSLLPATLLHSTLPTLLSTSTPLFLRQNLRIDPIITPTAYSTATFASNTLELFLRLPVETVLRRGQMREIVLQERKLKAARGRQRSRATSSEPSESTSSSAEGDLKTVVELGKYTGVIASMWSIMREEGEVPEVVEIRSTPPQRQGSQSRGAQKQTITRPRRGQGIHGLWRGWRVGWWGLVGVWGAAALGGAGGKGGEF